MQIVTRICGGLGNQLFIYAAARSMAETLNAELRLDATTGFSRDRIYRREYLLDQFNVSGALASKHDCFTGRLGWIREQLLKRLSYCGVTGVRFVKDGERLPDGHCKKLYLRGYWQSESYFQEHAQIIRNEFQPKEQLSETSINEQSIIEDCEAPIAIGVRRFGEVPRGHGCHVVDTNYYHRSIAAIEHRVPSATFFVFSEDVEWARSFLRPRLPVIFISRKEGNRRAYEDLWLMRKCRHFIVGNSTYHWWGAWLGTSNQKIVFAPSEFAKSNERFYPPTWTLI